jgi:hypothetical protein
VYFHRGLAVVVACAAVLTGCFKADSQIEITGDTADVVVVYVVDTKALAVLAPLVGAETLGEAVRLSGALAALLPLLERLGLSELNELTSERIVEAVVGSDPCSGFGPDTTLTWYKSGWTLGFQCQASDVALGELTNPFGLGDAAVEIVHRDGTWSLTGDVPVVDPLSPTPGWVPDWARPQGIVALVLAVSTPGELVATNATETDGSTARWKIVGDAPFVEDGTARLEASWAPRSSGTGNWDVLGLVASAGLGAVLFRHLRRSRSRRPG